MTEHKPIGTLQALAESGAEFIVVGGLAAVLAGVPYSTFDVDIVHARDEVNVERLLSVLDSLDAVFRVQPERRIRPAASHLSGPGHLNLITRYGPLDLLGTIGRGLTYQDLLPHSTQLSVGGGAVVRVLDLETVIALKEELGGEKDRAALPLFRRTLKEKKAQ